jgi:hypothetical protein
VYPASPKDSGASPFWPYGRALVLSASRQVVLEQVADIDPQAVGSGSEFDPDIKLKRRIPNCTGLLSVHPDNRGLVDCSQVEKKTQSFLSPTFLKDPSKVKKHRMARSRVCFRAMALVAEIAVCTTRRPFLERAVSLSPPSGMNQTTQPGSGRGKGSAS